MDKLVEYYTPTVHFESLNHTMEIMVCHMILCIGHELSEFFTAINNILIMLIPWEGWKLHLPLN